MIWSFPLPVLEPEALNSYREEVGPDLADLYDKWVKRHSLECDEARMRGDSIARIEVDRDGWLQFCRVTGETPNLENLIQFTVSRPRPRFD